MFHHNRIHATMPPSSLPCSSGSAPSPEDTQTCLHSCRSSPSLTSHTPSSSWTAPSVTTLRVAGSHSRTAVNFQGTLCPHWSLSTLSCLPLPTSRAECPLAFLGSFMTCTQSSPSCSNLLDGHQFHTCMKIEFRVGLKIYASWHHTEHLTQYFSIDVFFASFWL